MLPKRNTLTVIPETKHSINWKKISAFISFAKIQIFCFFYIYSNMLVMSILIGGGGKMLCINIICIDIFCLIFLI